MNNNKIAIICLGLIAGVTTARASHGQADEIVTNQQQDYPQQFSNFQLSSVPHHPPIKIIEWGRWGGTYEGTVDNDGRPHGRGTQEFSNRYGLRGYVYEGQWEHGVKTGTGTWIDPYGEKYEGDWADDERNGHGVFTGTNEQYVGEWRHGEKHGYGEYTTNYRKYKGHWVGGRRAGSGEEITPDGVYSGEWKKDKPHGRGVLSDKKGRALLEGTWDAGTGYAGAMDGHGKLHGKGVSISYGDMTKYEGDWVHGKKEGKGLESGLWRTYEGEWVNDKREGQGVETRRGDRYVGEWKNGEKHGKGVMTSRHGSYAGDWQNGTPNGIGALMDRHGAVKLRGQWKDGTGYRGEVDAEGRAHGNGVSVDWLYGTLYEGDWVAGKKEGKGKETTRRGQSYEGYWANGRKDGRGVERDKDGSLLYEGDFKGGWKHGKGVGRSSDGLKYEGSWGIYGDTEGEGVLTDRTGNVIFSGKWRQGLGYQGRVNEKGRPHGKGTGVYYGRPCNGGGLKYEGDWVDGMHEGRGVLEYLDGSKYEGDFKNNSRNGQGAVQKTNGLRYQGFWKDDSPCGMGELANDKGTLLFKGEWRSGLGYAGPVDRKERPHGHGEGVYYKNGTKYVGYWQDGKPYGRGVLTDAAGKVLFDGLWNSYEGYEGPVNSDGRPHGHGVGMDLHGSRYEGNWVDGRKEGPGTMRYPDGHEEKGEWENNEGPIRD